MLTLQPTIGYYKGAPGPETLAGVLVCWQARGEHFHSNVAIELFVVSAVNYAHSSCTDLFENAVVAKCVADQW